MSTPKLSILIPTLFNRQEFLSKLISQLADNEAELLNKIEILTSCDNGKKSIGQKRNELLRGATGDYVVFIDDDDDVTSSFIDLIFEGIKKDVDAIGIAMMYCPDNGPTKKVECSMLNTVWEEKDGVYLRPIQHVCPIKRSIALQVKYPEVSFGEDHHYSLEVNKLIKTEHLISKPIYFYNFRSQK